MGRIEATWESFKNQVIPKEASELQLREMKIAFYAGSFGLFQSMMTMLDPGKEPTEQDLDKMAEIYAEMKYFFSTTGIKEPKFAVVDGIMRKAGNS